MLKTTTLLLFTLYCNYLFAQKNPTEQAQPIVEEGKRLYRSEMASWYGTDLFLEKHPDRSNLGGYFSYGEGDIYKCVFYSKQDIPKIVGTISFDSTYDLSKANIDLSERDLTTREKDLYTIRKNAVTLLNADTLFKIYKNTSLNLIPIVTGDEKKVYILTGPQESGVVIFGNDYLITFDKNNNIVSKKSLHRNIIMVNYGTKEEDGKIVVGAMHSHLPETGEFISATDICTLMLYSKFAKWTQHNVVSEKYLNIWNCVTNQLTVVPMEK